MASGNKKKVVYEGGSSPLQSLLGMLLIAAGVLSFLSVIGKLEGSFFGMITSVLYGLGGSFCIGVSVVLLWAGLLMVFSGGVMAVKRPFLICTVLFLCVLGIVNLLSNVGMRSFPDYLAAQNTSGAVPSPDGFANIFAAAYRFCAGQKAGGGALGMLLAWPAWKFLGITFGVVVLGLLCIALLLALFRFDTHKAADVIRENAEARSNAREHRRQEEAYRKRMAEQEALRAERERKMTVPAYQRRQQGIMPNQQQAVPVQQMQQTVYQRQMVETPVQPGMYDEIVQPAVSLWSRQPVQKPSTPAGEGALLLSNARKKAMAKVEANRKEARQLDEQIEGNERAREEYRPVPVYAELMGNRPYQRPVQEAVTVPQETETPAYTPAEAPRPEWQVSGEEIMEAPVLFREGINRANIEVQSAPGAPYTPDRYPPAVASASSPYAWQELPRSPLENEDEPSGYDQPVKEEGPAEEMYPPVLNDAAEKEVKPAANAAPVPSYVSASSETPPGMDAMARLRQLVQSVQTGNPQMEPERDPSPVQAASSPIPVSTFAPVEEEIQACPPSFAPAISSAPEVPPAVVQERETAPRVPTNPAPVQSRMASVSSCYSNTSSMPDFTFDKQAYVFPSPDWLAEPKRSARSDTAEDDARSASQLERTLDSFGIPSRVQRVTHGPAVTRFEVGLKASGINVKRIQNIDSNIAMDMASNGGVRIEIPIPGTNLFGIEIPNMVIESVTLKEVLFSEKMKAAKSPLTVALGKNISGEPVLCDLAKMPHLLIAGQTGSGKSVCINTIINSLLYRTTPEEVRMIMIDPKVVELQCYNSVPHLLTPVVSDPHKASGVLQWAVGEMLDRYRRIQKKGVREISAYNARLEPGEEKMPRIVIIIDELADLMLACKKEVEESIIRIAQLARAAGIHMVVATQRPTVDVITGLIKANIPSRIAFAVSSSIDSRTILDQNGAEKLLGRGDMFYFPTGESAPERVQGCFLSDTEIENIVGDIASHSSVDYDPDIEESLQGGEEAGPLAGEESYGDDPRLAEAIELVVTSNQASISMLQRRMRIGHSRAGSLVDEMAARGIVSQAAGSKPREVLITREEYEKIKESL